MESSWCKGRGILLLCSSIGAMWLAAFAGAGVPGVAPKDSANIVDVSHGLGIPLGGLGSGYSAFGKYGFVKVNHDGPPDMAPYSGPMTADHNYLVEPSQKGPFAFAIKSGSSSYLLQEKPVGWFSGTPFDKVSCYAFLPKAYYVFSKSGLDLNVSMIAFTPMTPHDIATSAIPIQVFDITVTNTGSATSAVEVQLISSQNGTAGGNKTVFGGANSQFAFGAVNGTAKSNGVTVSLSMGAGESKKARFFLAWYYPVLKGFGLGDFNRYYSKNFANASAVIERGMQSADEWSSAIDAWHDAFDVPPYIKRLWFSSLGSVAVSTMLTADPYFIEKETPHYIWNTLDVNAYSSWVYLINWPEIERMDIDQTTKYIPRTGAQKGLVYHSAWTGGGDSYLVEPIYLARFYRDYLWLNDAEWGKKNFPVMVDVANRIYSVHILNYLVNSPKGNQSYDGWRMPGISAFNNSSWIYGLHGMESMAKTLNLQASVSGMTLSELKSKAAAKFDSVLWNPSVNYWNVYVRTPGSETSSDPNAGFTDQLFGKWLVAVDLNSDEVLPKTKVRQAIEKLYSHNLLVDNDASFRGWPNGMKYGSAPDYAPAPCAAQHARTCWFGAQFNLGSHLGLVGNEAASLDVFRSVEKSLRNNHIATGEWNRSINANFKAVVEPGEPGKDTPRFPPYPRFKSCWEYVVRMLGLRMDEKYLYLSPFKTVSFAIREVPLAGMKLSVKVDSNWQTIKVDGTPVTGIVRLDRSKKASVVEFSTMAGTASAGGTSDPAASLRVSAGSGGVTVRFALQRDACVSFTLFSPHGKIVGKTAVAGKKGSNRFAWNEFAGLSAACYLLRVTIDGVDRGITRIVLPCR